MSNNTNTSVPVRTREQRLADLEKATHARKVRAEALQNLRDGKITFRDVIETDDEAISRIRAYDLIRCMKGIGDRKAYKIMDDLGIAYSRRIGGLGRHQKEKLLAFIESREQE